MIPLSQKLSAVIEVILTLSVPISKMQVQARQSDFKSELFFHTCSVDYNLVMLPTNPFPIVVLLRCAVLAIYRAVPYSLFSFIPAALVQAMLEANTQPFQNALVKTRNQMVEKRNGLKNTPSSNPN